AALRLGVGIFQRDEFGFHRFRHRDFFRRDGSAWSRRLMLGPRPRDRRFHRHDFAGIRRDHGILVEVVKLAPGVGADALGAKFRFRHGRNPSIWELHLASRGAPVNSGLPPARDRGRGLDSFPIRADPPTLTARHHGPLKGRVRVPGDKSISHRALIVGALAVGETRISGLLEGEDVLNTAKALRALGALVERPAAGQWRVRGVGVGGFAEPAAPLDFGNSGTGCRLMLGAVAGCPITATFNGDASLRKRPMQRVLDPLERIGARTLASTAGRLPLTLAGAREPIPILFELPVPSAQLKSAVLLAGLAAPGETVVIEADAP